MRTVESASRVLRQTTSLCSICKQSIAAEVLERDGTVVMRKACPSHGASEVLLASDAAWYHHVMAFPAHLTPPRIVTRPVAAGCPHDCGACPAHQQAPWLPVIPITSACPCACPVCYTVNRDDDPFHISLDEFSRLLEVIRANDPRATIINLTGGEPTLHPHLVRIIRLCHEAGIHRVTLSTHGLTFLRQEALLAELAALDTRIVLSFHTFDDEVNRRMLGMPSLAAKMRVLDLLQKHGVDTTLIPVIALGLNDHEIGPLVDLALQRDHVRSLEIHTMAFTGQGGRHFEPTTRITVPDVLRRIEEASAGRIAMHDFVPSPCAHPLCYQTCYLLRVEAGRFVPFTRFMSVDHVRELLTDNLYMEPGEKMERVLHEVIHDLWARDLEDETSGAVLRALKNLLGDIFPTRPLPYAEQQRIAERAARTIYVHSHMDEDSFDTDRVRQCCVGVPSPDGGNIPTCAYNVLYRERDPRFSRPGGP